MAKGNDIDLENISMKKWKCEKKRVNKRKSKIIKEGGVCAISKNNSLLAKKDIDD